MDSELRRRVEPVAQRRPPLRRIYVTRDDVLPPLPTAPPRFANLQKFLQQNLLQISASLLLIGITGWGAALYSEFRASGLIGSSPSSIYAETAPPNSTIAKGDAAAMSSYPRTPPAQPSAVTTGMRESAATVIARDWSAFEPKRIADVPREPAKPARLQAAAPAPVRTAAIDRPVPQPAPAPAPKPQVLPPQVLPPQALPPQPLPPQAFPPQPPPPQVLASATPFVPFPTPHVPLANIEAKTSLVDFQTAPFPYHDMNSRTFGDDRVLLHIPAGFDPSRPAVMVVFFHGHGATLERDVRDRQRLPEQISAAGLNAVLVAPQFAYDAANSNPGKFFEQDGFKRFLDESAKKLALLYGDQRSVSAFTTMPIVLVSYSGGYGPTLSVLARGGANARIRGLVLLDSLYSGIDQFADWIASNRSTFFVSAYTPHLAHHNAELKQALDERSVPYGDELRRNHLQGMVTFMPMGPISHRDFVTQAWTDNPIEDILLRMTDTAPRIEASATAARRN